MAELARKIPGEVEMSSRGVFGEDLPRDLKEIERLAKSLRSQLNP